MEISIQGVVKVNYELVIDESVFNEACEEAGLDPANFKKFTKDDWDELNPHLVQAELKFPSLTPYKNSITYIV